MKKYLKINILMLGLLILTGCMMMKPSEKVESLFNSYIKNDETIIKELDEYIDKQELNDEEKTRYENIIKDEYSTIKYTIKGEKIKGDKAVVNTEITVKDLYKANKEAELELKNNPSKFYTNGLYDKTKFIDYKLSLMENIKDTVNYNIDINLTKKDNKWYIDELGNTNLQKIHGIYNYEEES